MKKNLLLISIFCLFSFNSFASNGVKRVTEMDKRKFISCGPIYSKHKNSPDPKLRKLSEYAADLFAQYFALANKIGGIEMKATLGVIYYDDEDPTPKELLKRGKEEARRQGIPLIDVKKL